jgi:uncharacterized protein (DUF3084 family)
MTSAYILIVAILVLGGVIATLGDRIGTKVGKARLSLFNLRPRKTATIVTIVTGSLISASTLGILFGLSESLREGVFKLDTILKQLRHARHDIAVVNAQKAQVEKELAETRAEQGRVQQQLAATNRNFRQARSQLRSVSQQASELRSEIESLLAERQDLLQQKDRLSGQITQLNAEVTQLREQVTRRDRELARRDETIAERNRELAQQDQIIAERESRLAEVQQQLKAAIAQRETRLQALEEQLGQRELQLAQRDKQLQEREKQLSFLEREVETLVRSYRELRQGNVALLRDQVLAFGVVRIVDPAAANQAIDQLLREANRTAIEITGFQTNEPLVQITQAQAEQLIDQIKDGQDYVVRILSAGNYVVGEKPIQVFADAAVNRVIFDAGDVLAAVSADSSTMTNQEIQRRLDQLLAASEFRARRAGVLGEIQLGGNRATQIRFIEQLDRYEQPLEVKVIAQEPTYTSGPLRMQLVATQNGQVVFST